LKDLNFILVKEDKEQFPYIMFKKSQGLLMPEADKPHSELLTK
jgi:hypothetical protein